MSKTQIIAELPRLSRKDRAEIRAKLVELDGDIWADDVEALSQAEKKLLNARLAAYQKNPHGGSSWAELRARVRKRLKK